MKQYCFPPILYSIQLNICAGTSSIFTFPSAIVFPLPMYNDAHAEGFLIFYKARDSKCAQALKMARKVNKACDAMHDSLPKASDKSL